MKIKQLLIAYIYATFLPKAVKIGQRSLKLQPKTARPFYETQRISAYLKRVGVTSLSKQYRYVDMSRVQIDYRALDSMQPVRQKLVI